MKESNKLPNHSNDSGISPSPQPLNESLRDFFFYLLKKWWLIAILAIIAGALGIIYASMQAVKYESNLTFVIQQGETGGGVSGAMSLAAQFGLNIGGGEDMFSGDNILEIIKSRRIVEKVLLSVDTFNNKPYTLVEYLLHHPNAKARKKTLSKIDSIHFPPGQSRRTFSYQQDSLLYATYKNLATFNISADRPDKKLSIFSIRMLSSDEKFTKVFTDKIIHATDSFYTEICSKKERETLEILEQRVAAMRGNLSGSISSRAATQDANVNPAFSAAQVPLQKQQANIQVYGAAYGEMFKNLELARYQYLKKIPLIQVIDPAAYPMKKIKVSRLKSALLFSAGAVFLSIFFFWVKRIYKLST